MSAAIVAFGAVSALGEGQAAVSVGVVGERARLCLGQDDELVLAGLARPYAARATLPVGSGDRATAILSSAMRGCARELDGALPGWRSLRVGLALGTSAGAMRTAEELFASQLRVDHAPAPRGMTAGALYFAPMVEVVDAIGLSFEPATLIMGACAASTLALGVALRWLEAGACDLALAGGFDAVSTFVATGFEVLRATTSSLPPRPFRSGRDGMALGEGAAVVALRPARLAQAARVYVTGFGASSDAVHLTAPDRSGAGLARAATRALTEAGSPRIDLVSPHGSATPYSDAAEARAIRAVIGDVAEQAVVHPFKAQIGHTLGAAGALEVLAVVDALTRGVLPAAAGDGEIDPDARVKLLDVAWDGRPRAALKLSAAFGGANAALVLSRDLPGGAPGRSPRAVYVRPAVHLHELPPAADLAARVTWPVDRVARADPLARWVIASVAALVARDGPLTGAGIVVGGPFATMETNASFFARLHERGVRMAEPRKFPYTSPNAAAGDASAVFGLTGPSFAVGCGLHAGVEALVLGAQLVRAGDAEVVVVAAADDVGPTVSRVATALGVEATAGVVALVLSAHQEGAVATVVSASCGMGPRRYHAPVSCGHRALLPLLHFPLPSVIEASSPDLTLGAGQAHADRGAVAWARVELSARPDARYLQASGY
jgi:3-oxoacyl-[acyl-carrier-protein] synthase-1/3-oxoacyl-[acyl-carrier-protein] synthase II